MPHLSAAFGKPAAHAPAPSSTPSSSSSSAPAVEPSKKDGRSGASKERRVAVDDPPASPTSSTPSSGSAKKPRLYGPEYTDVEMKDVVDDVEMHEESKESSRAPRVNVKKPVVSVSTAPVTDASTSSPPVHPSTSTPSAAPPTTSAVTGVNASAVIPSSMRAPEFSPTLNNDYVPIWATPDKLDKAGVESRVPTSLVVAFDVDTRICPAPVVRSRLYSIPAETKLAYVVQLLADTEAGFAIKLPTVPRVLLSKDAVLRAQLTEEQQAMCRELRRMAQQHIDLVRDTKHPYAERQSAIDELFHLLDERELTKMWQQEELTSDWHDLLVQPSAITKNGARDDKKRMNDGREMIIPRYSYEVHLCGATLEATYIIACTIASYAKLPGEHQALKRRLYDIVEPRTSPVGTADTTTESDSSDDDRGYSTYTSRRAERRQNRPVIRRKQLDKFMKTELSAAQFMTDSNKPLLEFATRVNTRPWFVHFLECEVTNWRSVGCGARIGVDDVRFLRVIDAIPWLQDHSAFRWVPKPTIGDSALTLFVREDICMRVPEINQCLRQSQLPGTEEATLSVTCRARLRRGSDDLSDSVSGRRPTVLFYLTPEKVRAPAWSPSTSTNNTELGPANGQPVQGATAAPRRALWASLFTRPAPGSRVGDRRLPTTQAIDHRPRKEQRPNSEQPTGTAGPHVTAPPKHPSPATQPSTPQSEPWKAELAKMRAELTAFSTQFAALLDLPRQFANFQRVQANLIQTASNSQVLPPVEPTAPTTSPSARTEPTSERRMAALEDSIAKLTTALERQTSRHNNEISAFETRCEAQANALQRLSQRYEMQDITMSETLTGFRDDMGQQLKAMMGTLMKAFPSSSGGSSGPDALAAAAK